jgi:hypothetical protein
MKQSLRIVILLLVVMSTKVATGNSADLEANARAGSAQLDHSLQSRDIIAVGRLLAEDCLVMMTNPLGGSKETRVYSKTEYLQLLQSRFLQTREMTGTDKISKIIALSNDQVCVVRDASGQATASERKETIKSQDIIVFQVVGGQVRIRLIVTELVDYGVKANGG